MYHISSHIIRIGKLGVNSWVNALWLRGYAAFYTVYAVAKPHKPYKQTCLVAVSLPSRCRK